MSSDQRRDEIATNLASVRQRIPSDKSVTLICVTKNFPLSDLEILYDLGEHEFGENRDSEGALKCSSVSSEISASTRWHYQGQIQSRKINSISSWADSVHSLDQMSHAHKFEAKAELGEELPQFFIQVNHEPDRVDRGGVAVADLEHFISQLPTQVRKRTQGLMTVAPLDAEPATIFAVMQRLGERLELLAPGRSLLSMGMSNDFEVAIDHGATHVRVGSSILGSRSALI